MNAIESKREEMEFPKMPYSSAIRGTATAPKWPLNLMNLPAEIQLEIFNHLDPVSAVVLSLSCKTLYALNSRLQVIHRTPLDPTIPATLNSSEDKEHPKSPAKIPLEAWCILPPNRESGVHLYELLQDWVPEGMGYEYVREKGRGVFVVDKEGRSWRNRDDGRSEMERRLVRHALVMKRAMEKARAWREANGWFEGGAWRVLCEGGGGEGLLKGGV